VSVLRTAGTARFAWSLPFAADLARAGVRLDQHDPYARACVFRGQVLASSVHRRASHASDVRISARMWPVGWEALERWGDVARIEPLAGGVANDVWRVRVDGHRAVGRLGARSDADLAWETELLRHLDREGLPVPVPIPATDGRLFADGLVVMTYVEGGPPETDADWRRVAGTLRQLHRLTQGWPQRPGWRSSTDLLRAETGTKIDLGAMPPEGVARCRAAWARLTGRQTCVVHGNPNNPGNVRMTADRVALIDWDESHVDVADLDLVLPHNAAGLDDGALDVAAQASAAWEAAVCWDDDYAVRRLAEVRAV
jgi:Ser/Thr protein kinase RdoA (MazF antagonist)